MSVQQVLPACFSFLNRSVEEIAEEFHHLPNEQFDNNLEVASDPRFSDGVGAKVIKRNRYHNIVANNATRVKLPLRNNDYINANHCLEGRVIISQGPLRDGDQRYSRHHFDFYDMLWTNDCSAIVMVTDYVEKDTRKCSHYLPDDTVAKTLGGYTVVALSDECVQESALQEMGIKITKVAIVRGLETKWITHYHYPHWLDNEGTTAKVVAVLARILLKENNPLIHCSAGIGRSGTVAAVRDAYEIIKTGQFSESLIPDVVKSLRLERHGCVQTSVQYLTIYEAVKELIEQDLSDGSLKISEITVNCNVPYPHTLSIRGDNAGLNWDQGKPLVKRADGTYVYHMVGFPENMEYKILLDDIEWERGGNHTLTEQSQVIIPNLAIPNVYVAVDVKPEGQTLFIRGAAPGLSWRKGLELKPLNGTNIFESLADLDAFEFKILLNDVQWELGPYHKAENGETVVVSPKFEL